MAEKQKKTKGSRKTSPLDVSGAINAQVAKGLGQRESLDAIASKITAVIPDGASLFEAAFGVPLESSCGTIYISGPVVQVLNYVALNTFERPSKSPKTNACNLLRVAKFHEKLGMDVVNRESTFSNEVRLVSSTQDAVNLAIAYADPDIYNVGEGKLLGFIGTSADENRLRDTIRDLGYDDKQILEGTLFLTAVSVTRLFEDILVIHVSDMDEQGPEPYIYVR